MHFFDALFNPGTIAVIGASAKKGKVGNVVYNNLLGNSFKVIPVNINSRIIGLVRVYERVTDYKGDVDLAVICIPAQFVPAALEDCGKKSIKAVIIISAGFGEVGNKELDDKICKICSDYKIEVLGPNCLGVINTKNKLNASFFNGTPNYDKVAFVSQSGALGVAVLDQAIKEGKGFSKFVSVGNMLNTYFYEIVEYLNQDPETDVICLYVEGLKKGKQFLRVVKHVKKPVIVLKAGRTKSGEKAITSHTGSLAGSNKVYNGVFKQFKVFTVDNIEEMFFLADLLRKIKKPNSNKVCVLTNAGGPGVLASDSCEEKGLELTGLPKPVEKKLESVLPSNWSKSNPIDVIGDAKSDRYKSVLSILSKQNFFDILFCILTPQDMTEPEETAEALVQYANKEKDKTVFACFMGGERVEKAKAILNNSNIINFKEPYDFARLVSKLVSF
ncbi:MAG: CoA-binding protein [Nanoarchaeota archaeon]|nr:CoA-binding protein [Nanoarchaeota archaeon]